MPSPFFVVHDLSTNNFHPAHWCSFVLISTIIPVIFIGENKRLDSGIQTVYKGYQQTTIQEFKCGAPLMDSCAGFVIQHSCAGFVIQHRLAA